jgi:hypothetical protein
MATNDRASEPTGDADIIDYLDVLWRRRWLIVLGVVVCVLATAAVTRMLPKTYRVDATVELGELSEDRLKDVDRIVARLAADGLRSVDESRSNGRTGVLAVEYKKPYRIELIVDTTVPQMVVPRLETVATRLVDSLNRLAGAQRADDQAALATLQEEVELALAQIQWDLSRRIQVVKGRLESTAGEGGLILVKARAQLQAASDEVRNDVRRAAAELGEIERERGVGERRLGEIETQLAALRKARSELGDGVRDLSQAVLFGQLSREILEREDTAAQIRTNLAAFPERRAEAKATHQARLALLQAIESAATLVQDRRILERPKDLESVWATLWRVEARADERSRSQAGGGTVPNAPSEIAAKLQGLGDELRLIEAALAAVSRWDATAGGDLSQVRRVAFQLMPPGSADAVALERALRRIEIEIPEKLRALKRQTERGGQAMRDARVLVPPRLPDAPIRPRMMLNLAAAALAGLVASVLLTFVTEYLGQARQRRAEEPR